MKKPLINRSLFINWSEEDLRSHYEFLLDREGQRTKSQEQAFEIVTDLLMEIEALEMANECGGEA